MKIKRTITTFFIAAVVLIAACKKEASPAPSPTLIVASTDHPTVVSKSPVSNATNVALDKVLSISFSETMNASTLTTTTFTLKQGTNAIAGTVAYSGLTATFTPTMPLAQNHTYTAYITTGVKSTSGKTLASDVSWLFTTSTNASGLATVNLGTAANYVILAKTAINNNPTSAITGDIGLSPAATSYITGLALTDATGYATSAQITGHAYAADMVSPTSSNLTTAVGDMITAYNDAAGRPSPDFLELATGNIGGKTLVAGLYKWTNTVTAPVDLVISGSATDIWIFQIAGDLTISSGVNITLSGGAKPENIFWQVAGEVTLGTTANFKGIVLSMTGITLNSGATFKGRALAQTAVILDANAVTQP
jgi:hypothetical protein